MTPNTQHPSLPPLQPLPPWPQTHTHTTNSCLLLTQTNHPTTPPTKQQALLIGLALLAPSLPHLSLALACLVTGKLLLDGSASARQWRTALELVATLMSVSLFLRSLPIIGTRIHLRKHHKLFRMSLMYRVLVHII